MEFASRFLADTAHFPRYITSPTSRLPSSLPDGRKSVAASHFCRPRKDRLGLNLFGLVISRRWGSELAVLTECAARFVTGGQKHLDHFKLVLIYIPSRARLLYWVTALVERALQQFSRKLRRRKKRTNFVIYLRVITIFAAECLSFFLSFSPPSIARSQRYLHRSVLIYIVAQ